MSKHTPNEILEIRAPFAAELENASYFTSGRIGDMEDDLALIENEKSDKLLLVWRGASLPEDITLPNGSKVALLSHGEIQNTEGQKIGVFGNVYPEQTEGRKNKLILHMK